MKIAIIVRMFNIDGGGQRQAVHLARELIRRGHAVKLYTFLVADDEPVHRLIAGIPIFVLPERYPPRVPGLLLRGILKPLWTFAFRWRENRMARRLALAIDRDTDVLNPQSEFPQHVAYYFKKCVRDIPSVWSLNDFHLARWWLIGGDQDDGERRRPGIRTRVFAWVKDRSQRTFIATQDVIAVFNEENQAQVRRFFGRQAVIVRSGLDVERFSFRPHPPVQGRRVKLLAHGFFQHQRRFEDAICAIKILADGGYDPILRISGNHDFKDTARAYHQELRALVHDLELAERVVFRGEVTDKELVQEYRDADIFLALNHRKSGGYAWGLSVFEAMGLGTPAVLNRAAGAAEVLTDRVQVILANPTDPQSVAEGVRLLADDPELYQLISRAGSEFVRNNISWAKYAEHMLRLFREAALEHRS